MRTLNALIAKSNLTNLFYFLAAIIILFLFSCDMENRYPDAGEFCTPMREIPECVKMDFRKKVLMANGNQIINQNTFVLKMINRAEYEYESERENSKLQVDVLSEHRIRIRTLKLPQSTLQKEETYIRIKGPKISLWARIRNAWNKKD